MKRPYFHFICLFPDVIRVWLTTSILGRAHQAGIFDFEVIQLRDFTLDRNRSVDDFAYGGGGGMVLKMEPLVSAVESVTTKVGRPACQVICLGPCGKPINDSLLTSLGSEAAPSHFILVCGRYEGIDQRFIENWVDVEVSLGDFVLTGGGTARCCFSRCPNSTTRRIS